ncbi:conserved hypothetical protein [Ricinus communis]|uniref:Uncharacterized protein n=1 Tax=Ricinus communis TaxID=3988 RepID=B9TMD8_RICCO|nr:conserved hypothetical protein [Ricinus communis]
MIDIGHHPHRYGERRRRQSVLQGKAGLNRLAEFAADAHRLPEDIGEAGSPGVFRHLAPAVDRDLNQLLTSRRIVIVLVGEDRELRADGMAAEIGSDIGKSLEPVDIIASYILVGMTEMIETTVGAGHARRHANARPLQCCLHITRQAANGRCLPAWIDELVRQLQVADA